MQTLKIAIDGYYRTLNLEKSGKQLICRFPYNQKLKDEIKAMEGARWNPDGKYWTISDSQRNWFNLRYLTGENVFAAYEGPLDLSVIKINNYTKEKWPNRPNFNGPYLHQLEMSAFMLIRKRCIIAGEMGTGKTLASIIFLENVPDIQNKTVWYVAPKSALRAVQADFQDWGTKVRPIFMTYDRIVKIINEWKNGDQAPHIVIFDECSKLKTPTTNRTLAAMQLADGIREDHDGYIIEMSGTPAPKAPTDWWSQCEVACPGFLKEGNIHKFRNRLAIMQQQTNPLDGTSFPKIVAWRDDKTRCNKCGKPQDDPDHTMMICGFVKAENEVQYLYERMKGLVYVKMKKDCLDLPDKQYQIIRIEPDAQTVRLAKLVKASSRRTIEALTLLRELSDGFQYNEKKTGELRTCTVCKGSGKTYIPDEDDCPGCFGEGKVDVVERIVDEYPTPKDQVLKDELELHEEIGRLVVYAGFKGTIDKIVKICWAEGWSVIRVDGRGWWFTNKDGTTRDDDPLKAFQSRKGDPIVFVGQPGSAGMGLTLTASPTILFYSNTFNGEDRIQSEDRIHRIGMDVNRGATIKDIFHLPTDEFIYNNLKLKKKLQSITLGEIPI